MKTLDLREQRTLVPSDYLTQCKETKPAQKSYFINVFISTENTPRKFFTLFDIFAHFRDHNLSVMGQPILLQIKWKISWVLKKDVSDSDSSGNGKLHNMDSLLKLTIR